MTAVAALFVRPRSIYFDLGADCYDMVRDARTFAGTSPVVAHPPCRAWGCLSHFAKPRAGERELAFFAVDRVRVNGGVLEHPITSRLWSEAGIPMDGTPDAFGGYLVPILQSWFGHRAPKATGIYVCRVPRESLPAIPFDLGIPSGRVELMGRAEREATPPALAAWLVAAAREVRA